MLQIDLSPIKAIEAAVQKNKEYISLSQGALKIGGVPQDIKKYLQQVLNTDKTDYYQSAWGILPLREKIASQFSQKYGIDLTWRNVLVSHGCMGAISTLLLTLLESGDEVILPEPTYPAYKNIVKVARCQHVFVSCIESSDGFDKWVFDVEKIKAAKTDKTKMVIFSNPCNPTGGVVPKQAFADLVDWCEKNKIYLLVDEAYDDYIFLEQSTCGGMIPPAGGLNLSVGGLDTSSNEFYSATSLVVSSPYVIRVGSYSKSLSMSGWRLGYAIVPDSLSVKFGITQDALLNCPNVIAQYAVLHALDHPEYSQHFHSIIKKNRDDACDMLQPLVNKGIIAFKKPDAGFYIFLKVCCLHSFIGVNDTYDLCFDILNKAKVGLIPGRAFGPSGAQYLRLCYAREHEVLCEGIRRLIDYWI